MPTQSQKQQKSKSNRTHKTRAYVFLAFFSLALVWGALMVFTLSPFSKENDYPAQGVVQGERDTREPDFRIAQAASSVSCADPKYANQPICNGHPRLHITASTLPYFQNKVATDDKGEYQRLVTWVDNQFGASEFAGQNGGLMSQYHAFIYLLGQIPGITYKHTLPEYRDRAIVIAMNKINAGAPTLTYGNSHGYNDPYSAMGRTYDWLWNEFTPAQRTSIATWLAAAGVIEMSNAKTELNNSLYSSDYFAFPQPWYIGLAFYGDGTFDTDAQTLVDSFNTLMLGGHWLDAQNWVGRGSGAQSQIGEYGYTEPDRHIVQIDGWRTATEENYFAQGTSLAPPDFIRYSPLFNAYRTAPAEPMRYLNWGQSGSNVSLFNTENLLKMLEAPVNSADPDMAGLAKWLTQSRGLKGSYHEFRILFRDVFLGDKTIPVKSPQSLNLPLTKHFEGIGMVIMRTGFESIEDTTIVASAFDYRLSGHDWDWGQYPLGFTIDKYGPLALRRGGEIRGQEYRPNVIRFTDPLLTPDGGFSPGLNSPKSIKEYTPGSRWERGGVLRLQTVQATGGKYDYVFAHMTKDYISARVKNHTRQYVYLRPTSVKDSDYLVIFDRAETTRPDILKRWELNMAYNPSINAPETKLRDGKWEYAGANEITVTNDIDPDPYSKKTAPEAHGKLFVKTLLPQAVKMEKVGGPVHEFENDAGVYTGYKNQSSDYNNLNAAGALFTGTYYTDIIPATPSLKDNFLHVLQTADTLNPAQSAAMVPTALIESQEGNMQGAFITSSQGQDNAVVMFGKDERVLATTETITYTVSGTGNARHLIADLPSLVSYDIYDNGVKATTTQTSDLRTNHAKARNETAAGTLSFTTTLGSTHTIQITPTGTVPPPPNQSPSITAITATPQTGVAPLAVSFTSSATDPDGTIASYSWNFGDGTPLGTTQNLTHTYSATGAFTTALDVTDNQGAKASKTIAITVTAPNVPPPPQPPTTVTTIKIQIIPETNYKRDWSNVHLIIKDTTTKATIEDMQAGADAQGNITFTPLQAIAKATYHLVIKMPHALSRVIKNQDISTIDTTAISFTNIPVGNVNDTDDTINSLDWALLSSKWGTNDAISDFNQDGLVNSLDWSIMNKNWGKSGEEGTL